MNLLERDDLISFLPGCLRTAETDRGLSLHRLTESQFRYFVEADEGWGVRARCPAGVMLHLETDSPTLELTGRILPGARTYAGMDVEVDGRASHSLRIEAGPETRTWRLLDLPTPRRRQVCVNLPHSAILELDAITLASDAGVWLPASPTRNYLAIGDSITQGMNARGPASVYPVQLARMLDARLLNLGVGGHVFDIDALDAELPFEADLVTVAYGTNDWSRGRTREQIAELVTGYLERLMSTVARSAQVFVLTPVWRRTGGERKAGGTLIEFSAAIAAAARAGGATVVDGTTLVPHRDDLFADGIHPADEGFLHYAINLHRAIRAHGLPASSLASA